MLEVLDQHEVGSTFFYVATAAMKFPETLKQIIPRGNEMGCHSYDHELLEEMERYIPGQTVLLAEERINRVRLAAESLAKITGKNPVSFRAPCAWLTTEIVRSLEQPNYEIDTSYSALNVLHGQIMPYHPSREDWKEEGDMSILEVPVLDDISGERGGDPLRRKFYPNWRLRELSCVKRMVEYWRREQWKRGPCSVLNMYMRPWEFVQIPKVILRTSEYYVRRLRPWNGNTGKKAITRLHALIKYLRVTGAEFVTATDFAKIWNEYEQ